MPRREMRLVISEEQICSECGRHKGMKEVLGTDIVTLYPKEGTIHNERFSAAADAARRAIRRYANHHPEYHDRLTD